MTALLTKRQQAVVDKAHELERRFLNGTLSERKLNNGLQLLIEGKGVIREDPLPSPEVHEWPIFRQFMAELVTMPWLQTQRDPDPDWLVFESWGLAAREITPAQCQRSQDLYEAVCNKVIKHAHEHRIHTTGLMVAKCEQACRKALGSTGVGTAAIPMTLA